MDITETCYNNFSTILNNIDIQIKENSENNSSLDKLLSVFYIF